MQKLINFLMKKPSNREQVCNYLNNYYGDQVCVTKDSAKAQ